MDSFEGMNIYEEALQVWGIKAQIGKLSEELFELGVAANHWYDDKVEDNDLAEEIADVQIMLNQMKFLVGTDEVERTIIFKLARLRERINICIALEQKSRLQTMEAETRRSFIIRIKSFVLRGLGFGD